MASTSPASPDPTTTPPEPGLRALLVASDTGLATALAERDLRVDVIGTDIEDVLAARLDRDGVPNVLVNVLAPVAEGLPPEDLPTDLWRDALDAGVTRTLLVCQAVGRRMLAEGHGVVVTVLAGAPDDAAAGILDSAATGLMRVLGVEWAPDGVRVMTIVPEGEPGAERDMAVADTIAFIASDAASFTTASEVVVRVPVEVTT